VRVNIHARESELEMQHHHQMLCAMQKRSYLLPVGGRFVLEVSDVGSECAEGRCVLRAETWSALLTDFLNRQPTYRRRQYLFHSSPRASAMNGMDFIAWQLKIFSVLFSCLT
jgi:hypothetical protein